MFASSKHLADLKIAIGHIERPDGLREKSILPFGVTEMDDHFTQRGLRLGVLHEFFAPPHPCHEAAMIGFVCGILARLSGPVVWCLRRKDLFAPGMAAYGLAADRVHYVDAPNEKMLLLLMEDGLRQTGLAGVVGEVGALSLTASRRLHLAARMSGVTALTIHRTPRFEKTSRQNPSAAETRWRIACLPSTRLPVVEIGRPRWQIDLLRCRDSEPHSWTMEGCDATGTLALSAESGMRKTTQTEWRAAG